MIAEYTLFSVINSRNPNYVIGENCFVSPPKPYSNTGNPSKDSTNIFIFPFSGSINSSYLEGDKIEKRYSVIIRTEKNSYAQGLSLSTEIEECILSDGHHFELFAPTLYVGQDENDFHIFKISFSFVGCDSMNVLICDASNLDGAISASKTSYSKKSYFGKYNYTSSGSNLFVFIPSEYSPNSINIDSVKSSKVSDQVISSIKYKVFSKVSVVSGALQVVLD
jgi:hypothetical protein